MRGSFDIAGYLSSRGITYQTEGKNISAGWLGTQCKFCNDQSNHLGINLQSFNFSCFKCGETGSILKFVAAIEGTSWSQVRQIVAEFSSQEFKTHKRLDQEPARHFKAPTIAPLSTGAKKYLREERGFPYKMLQRKYGIGCFAPTSIYRFRLFIPVYFNGQLVTFTTRSYNEKVTPKYLHCPKRTSSLFVKETLYNLDNAKDGTAIVVEGPFDAWRIGDGAVATFGVIYTQKQIKLLRERFKRVFIMYDADAQEQAWKLAESLSTFNMEVNVVTLKIGDPGSMTATEAREIRREIFGK
jgi:DNA primase